MVRWSNVPRPDADIPPDSRYDYRRGTRKEAGRQAEAENKCGDVENGRRPSVDFDYLPTSFVRDNLDHLQKELRAR